MFSPSTAKLTANYGFEWALAHACAALNALCGVDCVQSFDFTGDCVHRALLFAESAAFAGFCNLVADKGCACACGASLFLYVSLIFVSEVAECRKYGVRCRLAANICAACPASMQ